ncbi:MAG: lactate utilization protein [Desulfomonilaceae bacterium]|nr:lactate utilization protein [Desulfomonilaceae bacterium]
MDEFVEAHGKIRLDTTLESLEKHGFGAQYFSTKQAAADFIMTVAADCRSVGIAGTHTVRALGVVPKLEQAGKTLYDHWKMTVGTPEELECRKNQMRADLFLTSANAVTMTGEIVNRDGCGNRTNSMTFGPNKVLVVVGRNKVVGDLDAAIGRIEETAAPIRAMSLNRKTPCTKTGYCMDCDSPERICRVTSILHRKPMFTDITVVIIDEDLGY